MSARPASRFTTGVKLLASLAGGLFLGWARHLSPAPPPPGAPAAISSTPAPSTTASALPRLTPNSTAKPAPIHDLASLSRLLDTPLLPPETLAAITRLPTAGLQELLLSGPSLPGMPRMALDLRTAIVAELFHRGPEASLAWAASLPGDQAMGYSDLLLSHALGEQPALARTWMDRLHPGPPSANLCYQTYFPYQEAIARDAASALEFESFFATEVQGNSGKVGDLTNFPAGFDYQRFITATRIPASARAATIAWAGQDPEAAFSALSPQVIPRQPELLGRLAEGVALTRGEAAATLWLTEKLAQLPESVRDPAAAEAAKIPALQPPKKPAP